MGQNTKLWYLQNFNIFNMLKPSIIEDLSKKIQMQESPKKQIIYFPDDPSNSIFLLKAGKVKIYRVSENGKTTTFHLLGPGEIFGESALLGEEKRENIAEVVEDAVICSMDKNMFYDLMSSYPELNKRIYKIIGFRIRRIQTHVEDIVFKTATERILAFLRRYVDNFGKNLTGTWIVRPFLNHQEIANLTATTRQTVNAVLNSLFEKNIIEYNRRYLKVNDLAALEKMSDS